MVTGKSPPHTNPQVSSASASAGPVAIPPLKINETIQQRLLTGVGSKGGSRGSLTRCATKYGALYSKLLFLEKNENSETGSSGAVEELKQDLKREILLFQLEIRKLILMIKSNQKELQDAPQKACSGKTAQLQQKKKLLEKKREHIQLLRYEAMKSKKTKQCWNEYEALAQIANQRNQPRRIITKKMNQITNELQTTKKKLDEAEIQCQIREKQFQLLIQCMLDLKRSLKEQIISPQSETHNNMEEVETTTENNNGGQTNNNNNKKSTVSKQKQDEEDDGLYSDL